MKAAITTKIDKDLTFKERDKDSVVVRMDTELYNRLSLMILEANQYYEKRCKIQARENIKKPYNVNAQSRKRPH